ncbi:uncharacterized protein M421DRAFT_416470 [Didymella exigua CBS 183.55]|uniref:Uncharacterized protein n=1 Tax=Didymella exigua CBS 183.55 TaxID=1150837 RepID=A0A6A5S0Q9_9PLEO|nr:uncharacterized protein M421DRAFT_416470 [Didymella exigua CBS 183.55]KAF1932868.1 hypothetical protein M421DRAFT_416470 [Didymella exigua CBS 183.55]
MARQRNRPAFGATENWFNQFAGFTYDPTSGLRSNFDRLAAQRQWGHKLKNTRWVQCQISEFGRLYGNDDDVSKLEKWQELCREVHVQEVPSSITQCKKVLGGRNMLVNLVNLIDHRLVGEKVIRFKSYKAFVEYTSDGRKFPLRKAKEEGFIRALLRKL